MSQRGVPVLVAFLLFLVSACFSTAFGEGCGAKGDWKDIYILPTNPNADTNIKISLSASKTHVQPGETITFTIEADRDCYVTIMDMGTSGRIVRLWPNQYSQGENLVKAHTPRRFPSEADRFQYKIGGPSGVERIIAYATSQPGKILSESEFQTMQNTPFKQFVGGAKDLSTAFTRETDSLTSNIKWGSAQVNICIGSGESFPSSPDAGGVGVVYLLAVGAPTGKLKYCNRDAPKIRRRDEIQAGSQRGQIFGSSWVQKPLTQDLPTDLNGWPRPPSLKIPPLFISAGTGAPSPTNRRSMKKTVATKPLCSIPAKAKTTEPQSAIKSSWWTMISM
jgi:hypothetical protein